MPLTRGSARTYLRLVLGDPTPSTYSDNDLNTYLNHANKRVWQEIAARWPSLVRGGVLGTTYDANATSINISGLAISSVDRIIDRTGGGTSEIEIPIVPAVSQIRDQVVEEAWQNDLTLLRPSQVAFFTANHVLHIRPIPTSDLTLDLFGPFGSPPDFNADTNNLLDYSLTGGWAPTEPAQEAVVFEAAAIAMMSDRSLRQEFIVERDRVLVLLAPVQARQNVVD